MPFTLSHPAAAGPFWPLVRRSYLPLCALAIGTMSPDFEYLWRLRTEWRWSHTPLGVFDFCLPTGLVALVLWVYVLRAPARRLFALPPAPLDIAPSWWLKASAAIVLGATTHLVWDGFTHGFGWAVRLAPGLLHQVRLGGLAIPVFNLLQHASTAAGGVIVLGWLVHEIRGGEPRALLAPWRVAVSVTLVATAVGCAIWNSQRSGPASSYWAGQIMASRAGVGGLLGFALGLTAYAAGYRIVHLSRTDTPHI